MTDGPEGEGDGDFLFVFWPALFPGLVAAAAARDHGDDFAERAGCVAGPPGVLDLVVQTGPDFGFVVLEVGHQVVPCCGGAEGFD